ncbi:MAG TPA: hypothetical protein V6C58_07095, partial [Allocoleopsis sp.]
MKNLKNIILSTALAAGTVFGANAQSEKQNQDTTLVDTRKPKTENLITESQSDTTIIQPYFLIKDLKGDSKYRIDMNKNKLYPDKDNQYVPYSSFDVFKNDFNKGIVKPSEISGQMLNNQILDNIVRDNTSYKIGEFYVQSNCPTGCNSNKLEDRFLSTLSTLLNKYSSVCLTENKVVSLNGILTAEETQMLNDEAEKILNQYAGKKRLLVPVRQTNVGHMYNTKKGILEMPTARKSLVLAFEPKPQVDGSANESEFITYDDFSEEVVPCEGPDCDDSKELKSLKTNRKDEKKSSGNGLYLGASVGKNNSLDLIVPNAAIGLNLGNFSIGLNGGYATGDSKKNTFYPGVNGGYTSVDSTRNTELKQLGIEASIALFNGKVKPYMGFQNNFVTQKNAGIVEQ